MSNQAYYYRVRITGKGTDADPVRPDWPTPAPPAFSMAHNHGDTEAICMTAQEVSVSGARGAVVPIPDLPAAAQTRGIAFEKLRDEMAIGGVSHPERRAR
jgi:hypothetical protein